VLVRFIFTDAPLSSAFGSIGLPWAEGIVIIGALAGLTSVLLVNLNGQPRILMAMARDDLLPRQFFADIHSTYKTPYKTIMLTGCCVAVITALIPLSILVELVSMVSMGYIKLHDYRHL
jgi:APA family basic amino acid/polyamine antiporter